MAKVSEGLKNPLCESCGKIFDESEFYSIGNGEYLPLCAQCCENVILDDFGELNKESFCALLEKIDKAFFIKLWQSICKMGTPYFYNYICLLKENKLIKKKYADSDKEEENNVGVELLDKWGIKNLEDIEFLEKEYHEWETSYEIDSKAMVDSVKQLCLIELDIRKARSKSDVQALDKLLRIKSQILGDANLKPVQETGNAANEQVSIGMLIKKFEQEEPIPEDTAPDWIDEMKVWIVGQLARMEGLQSDVTEDFNKELASYGIDMELDEKMGDDDNGGL